MKYMFITSLAFAWKLAHPLIFLKHMPSCPVIAELQIKPKSKSNQTKNLERLYNWVVVVVVVVVVACCLYAELGTRTNMSETEVE